MPQVPGHPCGLHSLSTLVYWVIGFGSPALRERYTAALPAMIVIGVLYYLWGGAVWRQSQQFQAQPAARGG